MLIDASQPGAAHPDAPPLAVIARPLGSQTNNFAEYTAVILALRRAHQLGAEEVELVLDSKLIVEQLSGRWKIRHPQIVPLAVQAQSELRGFRRWSIRHEPRANNRAADALANLALDDPRAAAAAEAGGYRAADSPGRPAAPAGPTGVSWSDFSQQAPELAAEGERLFGSLVVASLATLRDDGSPRLQPVSVTLSGGRLLVSVTAESPVAADLHRDRRCALMAEALEIEGTARPGAVEGVFELLAERAVWTTRQHGREQVRRWPG